MFENPSEFPSTVCGIYVVYRTWYTPYIDGWATSVYVVPKCANNSLHAGFRADPKPMVFCRLVQLDLIVYTH